MIEIDIIIVGQGIAGTSLAFRLIDAGKKVLVIDEGLDMTTSKVSSGIMNPITGRRYVKSWLFDELLPEAIKFYSFMGSKLNETFIQPKTMLRGLNNILEENLWYSQSAKPDYKKYFGNGIHNGPYLDHFKNDVVFGSVKNSYYVNMPLLMDKSRAYLLSQNSLVTHKLKPSELSLGKRISFRNYSSESIVFAEGWKVIQNPLFESLPFDPLKGEILIIEIENYSIPEIVKNNKFILPIADNKYWVGSTNELKCKDDLPNLRKKEELITFLDETLNRSYRILDHWTGIRPATKYRRPFIGVHPNHTNVFLFNGLGTKGVSLAPFFSRKLMNQILKGEAMDESVDISRFYNL